MKGSDDRLLDHAFRRRRRLRVPRFAPALLVLAGIAGIVALWWFAFRGVLVTPSEWHAKQVRFERAVVEVVGGRPLDVGAATPELPPWPDPLGDDQARLIACLDAQVARGVRFTRAYHPVSYPWGDIPEHLTTSPDLAVRCLRALELDLQQLLHIDKRTHRRRYPLRLWADKRPNRSVDHRRMPNLYAFAEAFFERLPHGADTPEAIARFQPADVVFWAEGGSHGFPGLIGFVSDRRGADGAPRVVTIRGRDGRISDHYAVDEWPIQARFRVRTDAVLERFLEAHPGADLLPRGAQGR